MTREPIPCPFCKATPEINSFGYYHLGTETREIRCTNPECKIKPYIVQDQSEYGEFSLIEEWNDQPNVRWPEDRRTRNPDDFKIAKTRREVWKNGRWWIDENDCDGNVASKDDPKICGRCDVHIDSLRPPED